MFCVSLILKCKTKSACRSTSKCIPHVCPILSFELFRQGASKTDAKLLPFNSFAQPPKRDAPNKVPVLGELSPNHAHRWLPFSFICLTNEGELWHLWLREQVGGLSEPIEAKSRPILDWHYAEGHKFYFLVSQNAWCAEMPHKLAHKKNTIFYKPLFHKLFTIFWQI